MIKGINTFSIVVKSESKLLSWNIIDIFSLLCTFLLFSAVYVSIGIQTVQVPFFTNAASDKKDDEFGIDEL